MSGMKTVPLETLQPNPYNPRKDFDPVALEELAKSIQELGLLQPLVVYPENGAHVVLCGDRRRKACELAGVKEVPCRVIDPPADKATAVQMALVENLQREDLSIAEEAPAIVELIEGGMKRAAVAKALGKSIEYIGTRYALAKYPEVLEGFVRAGARDLCTWSQIGAVETPAVRAKVVKEVLQPGRGLPRFLVDSIGTIRRIEKKLGEIDPETRTVSEFCVQYKNPKAKIPVCETGYGDDRKVCEHYGDIDYWTRELLGLKVRGGVCLNTEETCLLYKRDRETVILDKLKLCRKNRLIKRVYTRVGKSWDYLSMAPKTYGGKDCTKCKNRYKVPDSFHHSHYHGHNFEDPFAYCIAADDACIKAKLKAYQKAVKQGMKPDDLKKFSDDELKQMMLKDLEDAGCESCWKVKPCAAALKKRGFQVQVKHDVELIKPEDGE